MTPTELKQYLTDVISHQIHSSVMIWGPPGIGKSSIVKQITEEQNLGFVDVRLSQLAPTDLRGLPVPDAGITRWAPPEFLPTSGSGVLFLDEINMAPPSMQGVAQQLILDRQVGSYAVPEGWFIWAAGNRKVDRASVFDMPAPLANRFIHLETKAHIDSFRAYAFKAGLDHRLIAFLAFRADLLHKMLPNEMCWPSPRSWVMADQLAKASLDTEPAVGASAAAEYQAYLAVTEQIPNIKGIISGSKNIRFPEEISLKYATTMSLVGHSKTAEQALHALRWLVKEATPEWVQLYATDAFPLLRQQGLMEAVHQQIMQEAPLTEFLTTYAQLVAG
jgi:hypothetical protein